ncbi:MAG: PF20097 family protein [Candidatus Omnitrophota bacterium]|nr:PF20097 family protein [Candidatus Omnitrophota bacterium]
MRTSSKCPKCGGQMEEGFILDQGHSTRHAARWIADKPETGFLWTGVKISGKAQHTIQTLRCIKCGFIESYASEE